MTTVTHNDAREELAHKALRFLTAGSVDDASVIGDVIHNAVGRNGGTVTVGDLAGEGLDLGHRPPLDLHDLFLHLLTVFHNSHCKETYHLSTHQFLHPYRTLNKFFFQQRVFHLLGIRFLNE